MTNATTLKSLVNSLRFVPTFMNEKHENLELGIEVFWSKKELTAIGYFGKAKNYSFYLKFRNEERMEEYIIEEVLKYERRIARKNEEKQKQKQLESEFKASDFFEIGDIIYNSWGYEQTNIEFYKVIGVSGKTIHVKEIYQQTVKDSEYSHGMACNVVASDVEINGGAEYKLRVKPSKWNGKLSVSIGSPANKSFYSFHKWDGRPLYKSWYY